MAPALSPKSDVPDAGNANDKWSSLSLAQRNDLARRQAVYAAMIEQVDQNIGKVVNRLPHLGQLDNALRFIQPEILRQMIVGWNEWAMRVGVPSARWLSEPLPQVDPAPMPNDLFVDTFGRPDDPDPDAAALGMWGSRVPPLGIGAAYYESLGADRIDIESSTLRMAVGTAGMSENGLMHNFVGQDIVDAGGFSVQLRVDDISSASADPDRYVGFGVGLSQSEAAVSGDIGDTVPPFSFRGSASNRVGTADLFVELDLEGNVKAWVKGIPVATNSVGVTRGTLLASFELNGFSTTDTVTVTAFFDGQVLDLDPAGPGLALSFNWDHNGVNYVGLSARASDLTRMDNLAIRKLPLAWTLASEYALKAGLTAPNSAPESNPDADRDNNLVEWLKGGDPSGSDDSRRLFYVGPSTTGDFRFNHIRLANAAQIGVVYSFQYSTNLVDWVPFTPEEVLVQPDQPAYEPVEQRVPAATDAAF